MMRSCWKLKEKYGTYCDGSQIATLHGRYFTPSTFFVFKNSFANAKIKLFKDRRYYHFLFKEYLSKKIFKSFAKVHVKLRMFQDVTICAGI